MAKPQDTPRKPPRRVEPTRLGKLEKISGQWTTNADPNAEPSSVRPSTGRGLRAVTVTTTSPVPVNLAGGPKVEAYLDCTIDDRYKVEAVLGEGGMGVVYRCRHTILGKQVAMKILRADLARNTELTERFLNEARAASAIGNLHIIDISDFGRLPDGSTYFVMEYLDGIPLTALIESPDQVTTERIIKIALQLAHALAAAHSAGIVHRDLKPDNIFLVRHGNEADFVKILDFGIAKVSTSSDGRLTQAGAVFGTPHYMSPEQAAGSAVDHRGDIYSLGIILYELLCGKVPFDADNFMGILTQHMYKAPASLRQTAPELQISPGLEAVVLKCLSKMPEHRYQTMAELTADLTRLADGGIPEAVADMMARSGGFEIPADYFHSGPARATLWRRIERRPAAYGIGAALVLLAVGLAVIEVLPRPEQEVVPTPAAGAPKTAPPAPKVEPTQAPLDAEELNVMHQVVLGVEPLDARVYQGDNDLGVSPVVLNIEEGKTVDVEIRRQGFITSKLTLDGSQGKRSIRLRRAGPAPRVTPPSPKATPNQGGEIINPWK